MYLTNIGMMLTLTTSVSGSTSSSDNTLQLVTVILTGIYVAATLVIVGLTIWQSKAALAASAGQSQAAIDAVHEQILASEKQAQEAMFNQFKPVIVPLNHPISISNNDINFTIDMENKGAGVALNTWGIFYVKVYLSVVYHFNKRYFLVPDRRELIVFNDGRDGIKVRSGEFHGYPTFPGLMPGVNDRGMSSGSRLMVTYNDVFENIYLVVFDYRDELGWEQVALEKIGPHRLDELIETLVV